MKYLLSTLQLLFPLVAFAQKEDYNWTFANCRIDFNYNPPKITELPYSMRTYTIGSISDKNGKFLFQSSGNALFDTLGNMLYRRGTILMHSPSLIPFPYNYGKTLFFYSDTNSGVCCAAIDNEDYSDIQVIKTFPKGQYKFIFIQQKNTENIWHLSSFDNKIEISLITKDGFSSPKILDMPYDLTTVKISYDNSKIFLREGDDFSRYGLFDFDAENAVFTKLYEVGLNMHCAFSKSGKYIYNVEPKDANYCNVVRYNIKNATNEVSLLNSRYVVGQIPSLGAKTPKLGPDGNIYVNVGASLGVIYDCDTENAYIKTNVVSFDFNLQVLPYTFHYSFSNTDVNPCPDEPETPSSDLASVCASQTKTYRVAAPEPNVIYHWTVTGGTADKTIGNEISVKWQDTEDDGKITVYGEDPETHCTSEVITYNIQIHKLPSASFDNAIACHGQPLKILSSGDAPFDISYTIDGEEHGVKTSETTYQLPDVPGKYVISKIKDASCETVPTVNNAAEIAPEMRQVRIVEE